MQTKYLKFILLNLSLIPTLVIGQFMQQGPKLIGTGSVGSEVFQGGSVAISSDGNTAIVGADGDSIYIGASWIFTRSGGVWTQQGPKLVGIGRLGLSSKQGFSVSISADGNTAVVGGHSDNNGAGAAWVFIRNGGNWAQQAKLVGTGGIAYSDQGRSIAIAADGNTVIIGGMEDNNHIGAAWVFTRSGTVWSQQGQKLIGTGAVGNARQGVSVALSSDGNTAIVGGFSDDSYTGAVWVYTRTGGVWTQQGSKLIGTGAFGSANQGNSVAISADGNTFIEGATGESSLKGAVWIFTRTGGVWTQQGSKLVGSGLVGMSSQGCSVAISPDGNTVISGGAGDNNNIGAIWVFKRTGGVWTQQGQKIVGTGAVGNAYQGYSVAIASDLTIIGGGTHDNSSEGASWVFVPSGSGIKQEPNETYQISGLSENYPNPFHANTKIKFQIVNTGFTKLTVYDIYGKEVLMLIKDQLNEGAYEVDFEGSNFTDGTYFYTLEAKGFIETKKMILIK